jgi:hypothetical protein
MKSVSMWIPAKSGPSRPTDDSEPIDPLAPHCGVTMPPTMKLLNSFIFSTADFLLQLEVSTFIPALPTAAWLIECSFASLLHILSTVTVVGRLDITKQIRFASRDQIGHALPAG